MRTCLKKCSIKYLSTKMCIRGGFKTATAFCKLNFMPSEDGSPRAMLHPEKTRETVRDNCMYTAKLGKRRERAKRADRMFGNVLSNILP